MLYRSIDCPSIDPKKCEARNDSVSLPVLISPGGRRPFHVKTGAPVILRFVGCTCVGCVQDFVIQNGDY